jgi:hypothetical protein
VHTVEQKHNDDYSPVMHQAHPPDGRVYSYVTQSGSAARPSAPRHADGRLKIPALDNINSLKRGDTF